MESVSKGIINQGYELVPLDAIKPHPRNANQGDFGAIDESVDLNGFYGAIVVNKRTGHILAGNHRWMVAREKGMPTIPVTWVDVDDLEELRIMIVDNRTTRLGQDDETKLAAILAELAATPLGLQGTGFDGDDLDDIIGRLASGGGGAGEGENDKDLKTDKDEIPDDAPTRCNPGDLWQLGNHRLLCGDSTKNADVRRLMDNETARLIWTDPPWNVDYGSSQDHPSWKSRKILNDNLGDAFPAFCRAFCEQLFFAAEPGAAIYMAMSAQEWPAIHAALAQAGFHWSSTIIWAKDSLVLSRKDYHTQYEPIWYGWHAKKPRLYPLEDRKQSDLWAIPRPKRSEEHPTMKPVELIERSIVNSSAKGDAVLDLFGGSGSTLIACETTGRRARLMELSPKYCDVILKRWEDATGKEALLLEPGEVPEEEEKAA